MMGGMRKKTSLLMDDRTHEIAKDRARAAGMDMGAWIDRAILRVAASEEVEEIDLWRASWTDEDKAIEAAFAEQDARADLAA